MILIAMCTVLLIRGATADPGEQLGASWPGTLVAAGAVVSILSFTLVAIHPDPHTIVVATVIALLAGFVPINFPAAMTSVGTLVAVMVLRLRGLEWRSRRSGTSLTASSTPTSVGMRPPACSRHPPPPNRPRTDRHALR